MTTSQVTRVVTRRAARSVTPAPVRLYALLSGQRPVSGGRMYAHTQAVINVLGMTRVKSAPQERVVALLGERAFKYHTERLGNFAVAEGKVTLTKQGHEFFEARMLEGKTTPDMVFAFASVFKTGKANAVAQVKAHQINSTPV